MDEVSLVPLPESVVPAAGHFTLRASTTLVFDDGDAELERLAHAFADELSPATGFALAIAPRATAASRNRIVLTHVEASSDVGDEGYDLEVTPDQITVRASTSAGVFFGTRTLLQLLPPSIEGDSVVRGPFALPAGVIHDVPRFAWRGMMIDIARHYFGLPDLKRLVDAMAAYKLNRLHLHLSDDQGFRIQVLAYPNLTTVGGSTAVGGGAGGFLTQADYSELVQYAADRSVIVVPEIDMPAHVTAMLASYGALTCDGVPPPLATGAFASSSLCIGDPDVLPFVRAVISEIAALTPGPYFHVGGDESFQTAPADYDAFVAAIRAHVDSLGKTFIGWEEVANAGLPPGYLLQHWANPALASSGAAAGARLVLSPSTNMYLDMKYDVNSPVGTAWAGFVDVDQSYAWDPATHVPGVDESDVEGVEAALWTETIVTRSDVDQMTFPRLIGLADIGWSRSAARGYDEYLLRLGGQGPRLEASGIDFYRSPLVPWE